MRLNNREPNEIIIKDNIAEVLLYNNKNKESARAIIDAEDVDKVEKFKWHLDSYGYVQASFKRREKKHPTRMHHIVMGIKSNKRIRIDHKDRNPLNNKKTNLRFCTHGENNLNTGKYKNNTSGFIGVGKNGKNWRARIVINKKEIFIGAFKDKIEAAKAYNKAALKYHKEFACLNELNE